VPGWNVWRKYTKGNMHYPNKMGINLINLTNKCKFPQLFIFIKIPANLFNSLSADMQSCKNAWFWIQWKDQTLPKFRQNWRHFLNRIQVHFPYKTFTYIYSNFKIFHFQRNMATCNWIYKWTIKYIYVNIAFGNLMTFVT
jgi:hypothetical protein